MRKEEKAQIIESIAAQIQETPNFYITDISGLNAEQTAKLRRDCFEKNIKLVVTKNTLLHKVFSGMENEELNLLFPILEGPTAVMYTETPNAPAKLIKSYNEKGSEKPALKGAYVQECAFVGADKLNELCNIKSREELIGDVVGLLQSPARNVISALQSAGGTIAGLVKTLSERE
ncbi:MAG: 50S ribosomal protein L10 [Bacteroidales bacterium]|nr:50S ribosomal protein L10 [Bacteroides sp.]MCM1197645.1 50S ribosomal protein L10 [Clostridium sp.]MCM1501204.1 50S ribosomal protein L10 [Bacteroidales bacterium]